MYWKVHIAHCIASLHMVQGHDVNSPEFQGPFEGMSAYTRCYSLLKEPLRWEKYLQFVGDTILDY